MFVASQVGQLHFSQPSQSKTESVLKTIASAGLRKVLRSEALVNS